MRTSFLSNDCLSSLYTFYSFRLLLYENTVQCLVIGESTVSSIEEIFSSSLPCVTNSFRDIYYKKSSIKWKNSFINFFKAHKEHCFTSWFKRAICLFERIPCSNSLTRRQLAIYAISQENIELYSCSSLLVNWAQYWFSYEKFPTNSAIISTAFQIIP